jgi:hypothetical protein
MEGSLFIPAVDDPECSAHSACSALALPGECCPSVDNVYLDCCFGIMPLEDSVPTLSSLEPSVVGKVRRLIDATSLESLIVFPTEDAVPRRKLVRGLKMKTARRQLQMEGTNQLHLKGKSKGDASGGEDRSETSLEGSLLIPTGESPECSANSACSELALSGECCPSVNNVYLDCCFGILPVEDSVPTLEPSASPGPSGGPSDVPSLEPTN